MQQALAHVLDVEVHDGGLAAGDQHAGGPRTLGASRTIGEVRRARHARQLDDPRPRCLAEEQDDRDGGHQQHAIRRSGSEHAEQGDHSHQELRSAEPPDVPKRAHVHQAHHGRQDDRSKDRLRQIPQQA